jgi:hypothetical protein
MFFSSDEISERLYCSNCKNRFNVPKILPCGNTICLNCEQNLFKWDEKEYDCVLCKEKHFKPENDGELTEYTLPVNKLVQDLLYLKPINVYRGKLYDKAEGLLRNAQNLNQNLNLELENFNYRIQVHCDLLRDQIDIAADSQITKINSFREFFIQKVDKYEEKCVQNSSKSTESFQSILKFTKNIDMKFKNYREIFNKPDLSDDELIEMNTELTDLENKLIELSNQLNFCIFDKKLSFIETENELKSNDIGVLSQYISLSAVDVDLIKKAIINKPIQYDYTVNTDENDEFLYTTICPFNLDNFLIACLIKSTNSFDFSTSYSIKIKIISHKGVLINEFSQPSDKQQSVILKSLQNKVLLSFRNDQGFSIIQIFDENLITTSKSTIYDYRVENIETNGLDLIYLITNDAEPFIHILDQDLKEFDGFGQNSNKFKVFYLNDYYTISIKDAFIYLQKSNSIEIIDRKSGLVANTIKFKNSIDSYLFQADSNSTFVMLDSSAKLFQLYDFDGELLYEISFDDIDYISNFCVTKQGGLAILDSHQHKIYLY